MDKLNILVTGGAGYIGSHIVHDLVELGHNTVVFDNFSTGLKENLHPKSKVVEGDIRNLSDLQKAFEDSIDLVFHFAALKKAGESMIEPLKYADYNIRGSINLIEAMITNNVLKLVFSSSSAIYGEPEKLPIDEEHSKNPTNYYGYTKLMMEDNLKWFSELKGLKYASLRYFNATGYDVKGRVKGKEKDTANLSPIIMEVGTGERKKLDVYGDDYDTPDGTCIRDYIHVNDLSSAHILAMNYIIEKDENLIVNLGTNSGSSVLEMIQAAEKVLGKKIPYNIVERRAGDPGKLIASNKKAKEVLGWEPKYSDLNTIFDTMKSVYF